jgi:hypothetical protein
VVQSQLKQTIGTGKFVLGRVEQGNAKPGQNAPWRLATPTDKDRAMASKYLDGLTDERFAAADDDTPPWEKDPKRAVAAACPPF